MARFAYDVNTRTRLIDVHKQFNGGLKTIDTDDALGSVYLRQAENVSLSEFGFIEKRYGTFKKDLIKTTSGTLQGYWEYFGFAVFVVDGVFYYKGTGDAVPVTKLYREDLDDYAPTSIQGQEWRYPDGLFPTPQTETIVTSCNFVGGTPYLSNSDVSTSQPSCSQGATYTNCVENEVEPGTPQTYTCTLYTGQTTTKTSTYQALDSTSFPQVDSVYKDMNAVNINNVLYIFTGKYPVYVKIVNSVPRFYMFPITIPTYDEIVVTGHNLLEEDYNEIYFKNRSQIQYTNPGVSSSTYAALTADLDKPPFFVVQKDSKDIEIKQRAPQIAYQDGGELDFNFKYVINPDYLEDYAAGTQDRIFLLDVDSVGYRSSGPGAVDYTLSDPDAVDFTRLHNYTGSGSLSVSLEDPLIDREALNLEVIDVGGGNNRTEAMPFANTTELGIRGLAYVPPGVGGSLELLGYGSFDLNTEKNGVDFISEFNFKPGEVFEFQLRKTTTSASNPTPPIFIPESILEFLNDYTEETYTSLPSSTTLLDFTAPKIRIVPVDENGNEFTNDKIIITGDDLTKTSTGYKFTVPANLPNTATITGYHISLRAELNFKHYLESSDFTTDFPTTVTKELVKIEELEDGTANNLGTDKNIGVKLKNLLAGTYDFRLRYKLTKYTKNASNFLEFEDSDDGVEYADVFFYNVPITAEKLQDFPGVTDDFLPKLKPIWTCNKVMEHYGKLMVWGSTEMPTAVFYSFPDRPTYFPSKFYLDFSNDTNQPLEAVTPYMNILVAQTASQTWGIRGNSGLIDAPAPYTPFGINSTVGTIAYKSVRPVRNHLFFLSRQGVIALKSLYAADEQYNIDFVDRNIRNIVPQDSKAIGIQFDNQYWLNFPNNSITLRWYIDKKAWVKDVYQGYATNGFNGVFKYQIVDGKLEYITHPSDIGEVDTSIYKIGVDYNLPTDLYQPIKAKFETSFLNQNYPFHPKNYKEAKLDFTLQNEYNKGRLAIFDSSSGASVTYAAQSISFTLGEGIKLEKNHRYRVDFFLNAETNSETGVTTYSPVNVTNIQIEGSNTYVHDDISLNTNDNTVIATEFMLTNDEIATSGNVDLVFTHDSASTANPSAGSYVTLRDVTYDDALTFDTYIISEDQTLNFNNYSGYDQASVDIGVDLTAKERLGDWTFGTSDFGKKVTAVKTIKLSGKGYNAKLYLEDTSKSKWTLESMGITYKMKRARSR